MKHFLTLLRAEKQPISGIVSSQKIDGFFRSILVSFKVKAELKELRLYYKTNIKEDLVIDWEYENLTKIVNNLISNSIKYTEKGKSIYVHTFIQTNGFVIEVKDEGIGINEDEIGKIFSRFYQ